MVRRIRKGNFEHIIEKNRGEVYRCKIVYPNMKAPYQSHGTCNMEDIEKTKFQYRFWQKFPCQYNFLQMVLTDRLLLLVADTNKQDGGFAQEATN